MIRSMTGYGAGESETTGLRASVEMRSVNGRFCEITVRMPRPLSPLEGRVRETIQTQVKRGNVSIVVRCNGLTEEGSPFSVDLEAGRRYHEALRQLKETLNMPGEITIGMLASYPGLLKEETPTIDMEQAWQPVQAALSVALEAMTAMKEREGALLARDLSERVALLESLMDDIAKRAPIRIEQFRQRLRERITALAGEEHADPQRLAAEVAIMAERCDITEEGVRLRAHCKAFLSALASDDGAGRRLNFLLQEMGREANTIGSKANAADISHLVVDIKEELEKIREQVQNIE